MRFEDLPDQAEAKAFVQKAVDQGRLSHASLLMGPPGVGQLAFAHALAQYLFCEAPDKGDSCGQCTSCQRIANFQHPDLHLIFPIFSKTQGGSALVAEDFLAAFRAEYQKTPYMSLAGWSQALEAENKQFLIPIHEIRQLQQAVTLKAFSGQYKIILVWQAHKMNPEAANAFLKLLEEPAEGTLLFLTSENGQALLPTILSRCQQISLSRMPKEAITHYLQTHQYASAEAAEEIAHLADGSLARAIELSSHAEGGFANVFQGWMRTCYAGKFAEIQAWSERMSQAPREYQKLFLAFGLQKLRDAMLYAAGAQELALVASSEQQFIQNFARFFRFDQWELLQGLFEQSQFHTQRNANAYMQWVVLSLRIHEMMRAAQQQAQQAS